MEINGKFAPGMFYADPTGADKVKFLVAGEQPDAAGRNTLYKTFYEKIYDDAAYHSIILHPGNMVSRPDVPRSWDREFFSRDETIYLNLGELSLAVEAEGDTLTCEIFDICRHNL